MKYSDLVNIVATDFETSCKENDFETFADMCRCYMWDSSDIKAEVQWIVNDTNTAWMEESEITIDDGDEPYKYKSFISDVRKELKRRGL